MSITLHYCEPITLEDALRVVPGSVATSVDNDTKYPYWLFTWADQNGKKFSVEIQKAGDGISVDKSCEPGTYNGQWEFENMLEKAGFKRTYID